jgi:hypothetical protein
MSTSGHAGSAPRTGDIVLYRLDATDVEGINSRRANFQLFNQGRARAKHPHGRDLHHASGHVAHIGTPVREGQEFPALVVAMPDPPRVNLQVFLDGSDVQWVTCAPEGEGPGTWSPR